MTIKKIRIAITALFLLCTQLSLWAVWEGNAGIAGASDFPGSGLFARSDLFPRNTIVEVLNLEKDITVRVVITGASGVPGVIAILSPEAGAALNIMTGSVSRVRISIPAVTAERSAVSADTTAAASTRDPDVNPLLNLQYQSGVPLDITASSYENPLLPLSAVNAPETAVSETMVADSAITEPVVAAVPAASELSEPSVSETESPVSEAAVSVSPGFVDTPVPESNTSTDFYDEPELMVPAQDETAVDVVPPVIAEEPAVTDEEPAVVVEEPALIADEPLIAVEEPIEAVEEPPVIVEEPLVAAEEKPLLSDDFPITEAALVPAEERPPVYTDPVEPLNVPEVSQVVAPDAPASTSAPTLEPVLETPPIKEVPKAVAVKETPPVDAVAPVKAPPKTAPVELPAPVETVQPVTAAPVLSTVTTVIEAAPPRNAPATSLSLPFITRFQSGSYYIQLATYGDPLNARNLVSAWEKNYPVCVERVPADGRELLKVYIGPVNRDEYGAVLERFKQLGFSDAFVKRIP